VDTGGHHQLTFQQIFTWTAAIRSLQCKRMEGAEKHYKGGNQWRQPQRRSSSPPTAKTPPNVGHTWGKFQKRKSGAKKMAKKSAVNPAGPSCAKLFSLPFTRSSRRGDLTEKGRRRGKVGNSPLQGGQKQEHKTKRARPRSLASNSETLEEDNKRVKKKTNTARPV